MSEQVFRQGDVLIKEIEELPKGLKKRQGLVVVRGESTGHAHRLDKGTVLEDQSGNLFLNLLSRAKLLHDEHKTIDLPAGKYAVIRQREYTNKDAVRLVVD